MFNKHCDYALNRLDKGAIVCQSVTGDPIRLTPDQFSSVEEFNRWKAWSDDDYHKIQLAGRNDDNCLSLSEQLDAVVPSAEDVFFAPILEKEQHEKAASLLAQVRSLLTERQYRRLSLYYLSGKSETEIAAMERVAQQQISKSIRVGKKTVEKFFSDFLASRV